MLKFKRSSWLIFWVLGSIFVFVLTACSPKTPSVDVPSPGEENEATPSNIVLTEAPTEVVVEQPAVLLVSGEPIDPYLRGEVQSALEALADESGLKLIVVDSLKAEDLTSGVKIVVGVGEGLDYQPLAANAPQITFVALGASNLSAGNNLFVIGNPKIDVQHQVFMAGYLSALITSDNKVAALISEDSNLKDETTENFIVGARFYCGICNPVRPPYNRFPQYEFMTPGANEDVFLPIINAFDTMEAEVLFVHGVLFSPELLDAIAEAGMIVISDKSPDVTRGNWGGTVIIDLITPLKTLWPELLSGSMDGIQVPAEISIVNTEMGLIKGGRFRLFDQTLADLLSGMILPGFAP